MTERWRYDEVKKIEGVEIRKFHASVFADVTVHSPFNMAGSLGFRPLVTYISQNQIEMTAPVLQEKVGDQSWTVSFVMPEGAQLSDLPLPKNSDVKLRQVPEHFAAALSFSGASSWKTIEQKERELRKILGHAGISISGFTNQVLLSLLPLGKTLKIAISTIRSLDISVPVVSRSKKQSGFVS